MVLLKTRKGDPLFLTCVPLGNDSVHAVYVSSSFHENNKEQKSNIKYCIHLFVS